MRIGAMIFCLLFSSISFANDLTADLSVMQKLIAVPQWGLVQSGTTCIEKYQFLDSGVVLIESQQQQLRGDYYFIPSLAESFLPAILINFTQDNQQPDCMGTIQNQVGTSTLNFLKKESDQVIYFCEDKLGKNCSVYLRPENKMKR